MFTLVGGDANAKFPKIDLNTFDMLVRILMKKDNDVLVVVSAVGGSSRPFKCSKEDTIGEIKMALSEATNVKVDQMELLLEGKVLVDSKTLADLGLSKFVEVEQRIVMTPDQFKRRE